MSVVGSTCSSSFQPPAGTDSLTAQCLGWCSAAKEAQHCPRCKCRACSFCAAYNPPIPPMLPPSAPLLTARAPHRPQEKRLFAKLNQKYKKPVNVAKCPAPAKAQS